VIVIAPVIVSVQMQRLLHYKGNAVHDQATSSHIIPQHYMAILSIAWLLSYIVMFESFCVICKQPAFKFQAHASQSGGVGATTRLEYCEQPQVMRACTNSEINY
jgi:hypothetical protein